MENPFEFHEEDTIIACVGDNGGTTDEDIRNGFKRTVELLTESLKTGSEVEDLLVYPIVYNARHSIELSLKIVIKMLWRIEEKKGICYSEEVLKERKKELHTHSIECLYKLACDKKNIDRRIPAYFENIEDMIYFYYFDEEGDAFKYELNKEDEPHMIKNKISHVSIELLETEFKEVMKKFDDLIYFLDNCIFEYSLGTFTKSLSRADIWDISKRLPVYEEWRTEKFKEVKDEIKQEYHLGSKEFSDAVNLIKENREFSVNIGCEKVFGSITENELKEYASLVRYYSEKSKSDNKGKEIGFDLRKIQKNGEILKKYLSSISMNTLNTLLCFSEMSNSFLAVEHLEEVHDDIVSKAFDGTYLIRKLSLCDDLYLIRDGKIIMHEDTDVLLSEYALLKVPAEKYETLDKQYILRSKKESYGYACLTDKKQYYRENEPDLVMENGSIDELILMMNGGRE